MNEQQLTLSVREAARVLGIGRDATYAAIRERRLRALALGRRLRVPRAELERFLAEELARQGGGDR